MRLPRLVATAAALPAARAAGGVPLGPRLSALISRDQAACDAAGGGAEEVVALAAGCFWGVQLKLDRVVGVRRTQVGYTGGRVAQPTYREVSRGQTGHAEAVLVVFDPRVLPFAELAAAFFEMHDPTTPDRQGNDVGDQYRSAIFVSSPAQGVAAEAVRAEAERELRQLGVAARVVTQIEPLRAWWPAEDYHQDYLFKGGQSRDKGDLSAVRCYG
jgi:methionine-S-sulfoxide reductase